MIQISGVQWGLHWPLLSLRSTLIHYWDSLPTVVRDSVARALRGPALPEPELAPIPAAVWSWLRGTFRTAPEEKTARLQHCVNADVPAYGNMLDRTGKALWWLRLHRETWGSAIDAGDERWGGKFQSSLDAVDFDDPRFLEGFKQAFSIGNAVGCSEYERQFEKRGATATDAALFDACVNENLGVQLGEAVKKAPESEAKLRRTRDDPFFAMGFITGGQRGHVDGCVLADALKRSG